MVTNILLKPKVGEPQEKFIKRFFKKCKKADIIKEHLEKVAFYKKPSEKRKSKILKNKMLRNRKKFHKNR